MKFAAVLPAALLGSSFTMALPRGQFKSHFIQISPRSSPNTRSRAPSVSGPDEVNPTAVYYDKNWAGAVQTSTGFRSVTGTITVPPVKLPPGADPYILHAVSAWAGIDGELACQDTILQAGVDMYMNHSVAEYWAWYEWFPQTSTYLPTFAITPGDAITFTVTATATSLTAATVSITNHRTGQSETATLANQTPPLCGFNAEWIVEDFWDSDGVPLADFGSIEFSGAGFTTEAGVKGGVKGAKMDGVKDVVDGPVVVDCGVVGGDGLTCFYRGARRVEKGGYQSEVA